MLFKLVLPYAIGILAAVKCVDLSRIMTDLPSYSIGILIALFYIVFYLSRILIFAQLFFLCYGFWQAEMTRPERMSTHFSQHSSSYFIGVIQNEPQLKSEKLEFVLRIIGNTEGQSLSGNLLTYLYQDTTSALSYQYGDVLLIPNRLQSIPQKRNIHAFDYAQYLRTQEIFHRQYLSKEQLVRLATGQGNLIKGQALQIRQQILKKLHTYFPEELYFQLLSAITIGFKGHIQADTYALFSQTGTVHILSISGMHIGILFSFIYGLLSYFKYFFSARYLIAISSFILIWIYIYCSGLAPSAVRAGIMLTYFLIIRNLYLHISSFQSLFAAAFLNLLIFPLDIFHLGFQLSYLAVLGILMMFKMLSYVWIYSNPIQGYMVLCMFISLAAQLFSGILAAYVFGYFPSYFLLANLYALIPIHIILLGGFLLAISPIYEFNLLLAWLLEQQFKWMLYGLEVIQQLPYAVVSVRNMDFIYMLLLYIWIYSVYYVFQKQQSAALIRSLLLYLLLLIYADVRYYTSQKFVGIHYYQLLKEIGLALIYRGQMILITTVQEDHFTYKVHMSGDIQRYHLAQHIMLQKNTNYTFRSPYFNILILQDIVSPTDILEEKYDFILLYHIKKEDFWNLVDALKSDTILIDGSYTAAEIQEWTAILTARNQSFLFTDADQTLQLSIVSN